MYRFCCRHRFVRASSLYSCRATKIHDIKCITTITRTIPVWSLPPVSFKISLYLCLDVSTRCGSFGHTQTDVLLFWTRSPPSRPTLSLVRLRMRETARLSHGEVRLVGGKGATSPSYQNACALPCHLWVLMTMFLLNHKCVPPKP